MGSPARRPVLALSTEPCLSVLDCPTQESGGVEICWDKRSIDRSTMPAGTTPFPFGDCRICADKATGMHYGVATCEGCKGFFKRSIPKAEKYKCFFGGQCVLNPQNRNRCKACRFRICLAMGMSVDAVKMGRIPKVDKERAIEAYRREHATGYMGSQQAMPNMTSVLNTSPQPSSSGVSNMNFPFTSNAESTFSYSTNQVADVYSKVNNSVDTEVCDSDSSGFTASVKSCKSWNSLDLNNGTLMSDPSHIGAVSMPFEPQLDVPLCPDASSQYLPPARKISVGKKGSPADNVDYDNSLNVNPLSISPARNACLIQGSNNQSPKTETDQPIMSNTDSAVIASNQNQNGNMNSSVYSNSWPLDGLQARKPSFNPQVIKEIIDTVIKSGQGQELQQTLVDQFLQHSDRKVSSSSVSNGLSDSGYSIQEVGLGLKCLNQGLLASTSSLVSSHTEEENNYKGSFEQEVWQEMGDTFSHMRLRSHSASVHPDHHCSYESLPSVSNSHLHSLRERKVSCPVYSVSNKNNHIPGMNNLHEVSAPRQPQDSTMGKTDFSSMHSSVSHSVSSSMIGSNTATAGVSRSRKRSHNANSNYLDNIPGQINMDFNDIGLYLNQSDTGGQGHDDWGKTAKISNQSSFLDMSAVSSFSGESGLYFKNYSIDQLIVQFGDLSVLFSYFNSAGQSFREQVEQDRRLIDAENSGEIAVHPLNQLQKAKKQQVMYVWDQLMESIPQCNVLVLGLCRDIPQFADLDPKDQAILMEEAYFEIWLTMNAPLFCNGDSYLRLPCKARYSRWWMHYFLPQSLVQRMFNYTQEINDCILSHTHLVIISAILLTNPERPGLVSQSQVESLHKMYVCALSVQIRQSHPNNYHDVLTKIFTAVPQLAPLNKDQAEIIGQFRIDSPPDGVLKYVESDSDEDTSGLISLT